MLFEHGQPHNGQTSSGRIRRPGLDQRTLSLALGRMGTQDKSPMPGSKALFLCLSIQMHHSMSLYEPLGLI